MTGNEAGAAPAPAGDYAVARVAGDLVFTAGMTPRAAGSLIATGKVGADIDVQYGQTLAAAAVERAVRAAQSAADRVGRSLGDAVSMTVYIAAADGFTRHSEVADGASSRLRELLGGPMPARAAIGVANLPSDAPIEIQLVATLT